MNQSTIGKVFGWFKSKPENYHNVFDRFKKNVVKDIKEFYIRRWKRIYNQSW